MKVIKIKDTYINAETIKSFKIFHDENFIELEIFNGKIYTKYFEIFQSKKLEYHYIFGTKQNSKTSKILDEIANLMQKLCENINNTLIETLCFVERRCEDFVFRLDDEITQILEKSEIVKNIQKLVVEYEKEQNKNSLLTRFFYKRDKNKVY